MKSRENLALLRFAMAGGLDIAFVTAMIFLSNEINKALDCSD